MGTRADFYIGRGMDAEWLGSIAYDGYPDDNDVSQTFAAQTPDEFRTFIKKLGESCDYFTSPEQGWPWPWDDSKTTDWAYAFADGKVWMSNFGRRYIEATSKPPEEWPAVPRHNIIVEPKVEGTITDSSLLSRPVHEGALLESGDIKDQEFPLHGGREKAVTFGPRSGLLILRG